MNFGFDNAYNNKSSFHGENLFVFYNLYETAKF